MHGLMQEAGAQPVITEAYNEAALPLGGLYGPEEAVEAAALAGLTKSQSQLSIISEVNCS
jgi:hypothetical protein